MNGEESANGPRNQEAEAPEVAPALRGSITIEKVVVNGRAECTSNVGVQVIATLMASQFINVKDKTLNKGDAYGVGVSCEPVDVEIVTDKGTWNGGAR